MFQSIYFVDICPETLLEKTSKSWLYVWFQSTQK